MTSGRTAAELMDRREIRENVTRALASLPVSSMFNVHQISSALSQSTVRNHLRLFSSISGFTSFNTSMIKCVATAAVNVPNEANYHFIPLPMD